MDSEKIEDSSFILSSLVKVQISKPKRNFFATKSGPFFVCGCKD